MLNTEAKNLLSILLKSNERARKELEKEANLLFIPLKLKHKFYSDPINVPEGGEGNYECWYLTIEPLENGRVRLNATGEWSQVSHIGEAPPEFLEKAGEAFETLIENIIYGAEYECQAIQSIRQSTNTKMRKCVMYLYDLCKPKRKTKNYKRLVRECTDKRLKNFFAKQPPQ